jgi:hypothetical protein
MLVSVLGLAVVAALGADPMPAAKNFVGEFQDAPKSARLAIVLDDKGQYILYACSDDPEWTSNYSGWFKGKLGADGSFEVTVGELAIKGTIQDNSARGSLTGKNGKEAKFTAVSVTAGIAGLYRLEGKDGDEYVAGWIVDPSSEVTGAVKTKKASAVAQPLAFKPNANQSAPSNKTNLVGAPIAGGKVLDGTGSTGKADQLAFTATVNQLPAPAAQITALKKGKLLARVEVNGGVIAKNKQLAEGVNQLVTLDSGETIGLLIKNGVIVAPVLMDPKTAKPTSVIAVSTAEERSIRGCIGVQIRKKNGDVICIGISIEKDKD